MSGIGFGIAAGLIFGGMFLGFSIEAGLKAIAEALKHNKTFNVNLPQINIRHEDER